MSIQNIIWRRKPPNDIPRAFTQLHKILWCLASLKSLTRQPRLNLSCMNLTPEKRVLTYMLKTKFAFGKFKTLIAFLLLPIHSVCGQQPLSLFDKFQAIEVLEIDLSTDLKLLRDQRNTNE